MHRIGRAMFHITRAHTDRILGVALLVAVVLSIAVSSIEQLHEAHAAACQRRVNQAFQAAIVRRSKEQAGVNRALEHLWESLFTLRGSKQQQVAEFTASLHAWESRVNRVQGVKLPLSQGPGCGG